MTPKEILLAAADWLEEHEWCQHDFGRYTLPGGDDESWEPDERDNRRYVFCACGIGAMYLVSKKFPGNPVLLDAFDLLCKTNFVENFPDDFNDTPGRTKEEVIEALRRAGRG